MSAMRSLSGLIVLAVACCPIAMALSQAIDAHVANVRRCVGRKRSVVEDIVAPLVIEREPY